MQFASSEIVLVVGVQVKQLVDGDEAARAWEADELATTTREV